MRGKEKEAEGEKRGFTTGSRMATPPSMPGDFDSMNYGELVSRSLCGSPFQIITPRKSPLTAKA